MDFSTLLLDLDGTVYSNDSNLWSVIRDQISSYMHIKMGIEWDEVANLRHKYFEEYGTTLRGLQANHEIDTFDYLNYVHNVPLGDFIAPDEELNQQLASLKLNKWIFTNADHSHAVNVLNHLNLTDHFSGIIGVEKLGFINKPSPQAFETSLRICGEPESSRCIFIDDSYTNVLAAKKLGFHAILITDNGEHEGIDHVIPYLKDLAELLPELWDPSRQKN